MSQMLVSRMAGWPTQVYREYDPPYEAEKEPVKVMSYATIVYLIGSLRNPEIPIIATALRKVGLEVVDDWYAAGPEADARWQEYEEGRGHSYTQALEGLHADHVFRFDKYHLDRCHGVILALPAGKSGHLEFGYAKGCGKWGLILLDSQEPNPRFDIMYKFADGVYTTLDGLVAATQERMEVPF